MRKPRIRTIRFRVICEVHHAEAHKRVLELLAVRSILPDFHSTSLVGTNRVALDVVIRSSGLWAISLARLFERLANVLEVQLEINTRPVEFRELKS